MRGGRGACLVLGLSCWAGCQKVSTEIPMDAGAEAPEAGISMSTDAGTAGLACALRIQGAARVFPGADVVINRMTDLGSAPGAQLDIEVVTAAAARVELYQDGELVDSQLGPRTIRHELDEGLFVLEADCTLGDETASAEPVRVAVDLTPPECELTNPTDGAVLYAGNDDDPTRPGTQVLATGFIDDAVGAELRLDGELLTPAFYLTEVYAVLDLENLPLQTFELELHATDRAGNDCADRVSFELRARSCDIEWLDPGVAIEDDASALFLGVQAELVFQVSPECAGRPFRTSCSVTTFTSTVPDGGALDLLATVCTGDLCAHRYECNATVVSEDGVLTSADVSLVVNTAGADFPDVAQLSLEWKAPPPFGLATHAVSFGPDFSFRDPSIVAVQGAETSLPCGVTSSVSGEIDALGRGGWLDYSVGSGLGDALGLVAHYGDGFAFCEAVLQGRCLAHDARGNPTWTASPFDCANDVAIGPSAGELHPQAGLELALVSQPALITVISAAQPGVPLGRFDAQCAASSSCPGEPVLESFDGHVALADVDGQDPLEIIAVGALTGRVLILKTAELPEVDYYSASPSPDVFLQRSGPAVADLDGDGEPEIVYATVGDNDDVGSPPPAVYAFSPSHGAQCKYRWLPATPLGFAHTSPVLGDVDGDGQREVVVLSNSGVLSILEAPSAVPGECVVGTESQTYRVGWTGLSSEFTPVLAELNGDGVLDVVVAAGPVLEVFDAVVGRPIHRYVAFSGVPFGPSGAYYRGQLVVSGGTAGAFSFRFPAATVTSPDWTDFMGDSTRTGAR